VEIASFLHLSFRRIVALAVLAVFAAVPTAALLLRGPSEYRASVNVRMGQFIAPGAGSWVRDQLEADFQTAVHIPQVQQGISSQVGVTKKDLVAHLGVAIPATGTTVKMSYTDRSPQKALLVAQTAAFQGLTFLSQQQVDLAAGGVHAAEQGVATALAQLEAFQKAHGAGAEDDQLKALTQQALVLQDRMALGTGAGPGVADTLATTDGQLQSLEAVVPGYRQLTGAFDRALAGANTATATYTSAEASLAAASSRSLVTPASLAPVSRLRRTAVYGFGAGLVAVLVAVTILAVEELRRRTFPVATGHGPRRPHRTSFLRLLVEPLLGRVSPDATSTAGLALLLPLGVVIGVAVVTLLSQGRTTLALVVAAPLGLIAGITAFTHFEWFLMAMIAVRSSLDSLSVSSGSGKSGLDPGVAVGAVFIVASLLWLAAQRRAGRWYPVSRSTKALWVFAAACALSVATSLTPSGSAVTAIKVIAGVLMFSVLEQYLKQRPERVQVLITCLFLSLIVPAVVGIHQWVTNHGNTYTADVSRVAGTFVQPGSFADYLLLLLPLAVLLLTYYRGWARAAMVTVVFVAGGLLLVTYTREAWLAAIVSLGYLGVRARREVLYAMVAALVVLVLAVPSVTGRLADLHSKSVAPGAPNNSLSWRVGYWKRLIPMAGVNPITGIGFDAVERITPEQLQPHNVFVEAYVETGLVGLVALLGVIWCFAGDLRRRLRNARRGWEELLALAAVAVALGLLAGFPGENLLTQTFVFWYAAAAMTFGYQGAGGAELPAAPGEHDARPLEPALERGLVSVD
jgi:O-antigen ligase